MGRHRPCAVKHDLGALELRADDERRQQTADVQAYCFPTRGQCVFRPASSAGRQAIGPLRAKRPAKAFGHGLGTAREVTDLPADPFTEKAGDRFLANSCGTPDVANRGAESDGGHPAPSSSRCARTYGYEPKE